MADDNQIAMQVQVPQWDLGKQLDTLSNYDMREAQARLHGAQAGFQENRMAGLVQANKLLQAGDRLGAAKIMAGYDPEYAEKMLTVGQNIETYGAQEKYGTAAALGDRNAGAQVSKFSPQAGQTLGNTYNEAQKNTREDTVAHRQALGAAATGFAADPTEGGRQRAVDGLIQYQKLDPQVEQQLRTMPLASFGTAMKQFAGSAQTPTEQSTTTGTTAGNVSRAEMIPKLIPQMVDEAVKMAERQGLKLDPVELTNRYMKRFQVTPGPAGQNLPTDSSANETMTPGMVQRGNAVPQQGQQTPQGGDTRTLPGGNQPGNFGQRFAGAGAGSIVDANGNFIPKSQSQQSYDTHSGQQKAANDESFRKEAFETGKAAQEAKYELSTLHHDLFQLGDKGFLAPGTQAGVRTDVAKAINSGLSIIGAKPMFDPQKVAASEEATKASTRLGYATSKLLGTREAAQIVQQSVGIQAGINITPEGNAKIMGALFAIRQREIDRLNYMNDFDGPPMAADKKFNEQHPVEYYVGMAQKLAAPMRDKHSSGLSHVEYLQANPSSAKQFDRNYGAGLSHVVLGTPLEGQP